MSAFKKAIKQAIKLRMAISGPSGSGKTYTALNLAKYLGGKVAVIDTERGSASKYADVFDFDVAEMEPPYHPDRYCKAIDMAAAEYDILIIDSLSHAWNGPGGLLEELDKIAKRMKTTNSMMAWKEATPIQNRMYDTILRADCHVIATMRSKHHYDINKDDQGKVSVVKLGLAPQQREGTEYEFDIAAEMDLGHNMLINKTRCAALTDGVFNKPGEELAGLISHWLTGTGSAPSAPTPYVAPTIEVDPALTKAIVANATHIATLKDSIAAYNDGDEISLELGAVAWQSISNTDKKALWVDEKLGGPFSNAERSVIKSDAFKEARKGVPADEGAKV